MSLYQPRGECPTLSQPMATGDGLLLRLTPIAPLEKRAWTVLADFAAQHGNGLLDLTLRGGIQVRGLSAQGAALAPETLPAAGFAEQSPVLATDPLGLDDPHAWGDSHALAASIAPHLSHLPPGLPAKVTLALDGAGRLDDLAADLRLRWVAKDRVRLAVGPSWVAEDTADHIAALTLDWLRRLAQAGSRAAALAPSPALPPPPPGTALPLGPVTGSIALAAPAFGALTVVELRAVLALPGLVRLRPAAGRRLALWFAATVPSQWPDFLALDGNDPRLGISACIGAPGCAAALQATRTLAQTLAATDAALGPLHLSGCVKACGAPRDGTAHAAATPTGWAITNDHDGRLRAALALRGEKADGLCV